MLIPLGSKVIIKFTGEEGVVTRQLEDEMFEVHLLDADTKISVPARDIRILQASAPTAHTGEHANSTDEINISLAPGIHLIFKSNDHHLINKKYDIHLANSTEETFVYEYKFRLGNDVIHTQSQRISNHVIVKVGTMMYEDLNEKASIILSKAHVSTAGLDPWKRRTLHLKMKQFFKKQEIGEADGCIYHDYTLTGWETVVDPSDVQKLTTQRSGFKKANPMARHQVISVANFEVEIDLHINKLTANHEGLAKYQILTIQLEYMKRYIAKAKNLRMDRVFLIHGVGKGRLKRDIANYLQHDDEVLYFKNEYHPKYGYGATEVVFR